MTRDEQDAIVAAVMSKHAGDRRTLSGRQVIAMAGEICSSFLAAGASDAELQAWAQSAAEGIEADTSMSDEERELMVRSLFDAFGFDLNIERTHDGRKRYCPKTRVSH